MFVAGHGGGQRTGRLGRESFYALVATGTIRLHRASAEMGNAPPLDTNGQMTTRRQARIDDALGPSSNDGCRPRLDGTTWRKVVASAWSGVVSASRSRTGSARRC